jgi:Uma2 family endonuclease
MSTVIDPDRLYTPEDLLTLPDGDRYELVDGHLVEPNVSNLANDVEAELVAVLRTFCKSSGLGRAFASGNMFRCFPWRPGLIRKPDASFIRTDRLTFDQLNEGGWFTMAPDLAVEVVSPNDEAEELEAKLRDYLRAGVQLLWVVFPKARLARVLRPDGPDLRLNEDEILDGEDILPGFRCRLGDLFPPRPEAPPPA